MLCFGFFVFGIFVGVVVIIGVEVGLVLFLINKLNQKSKKLEQKAAAAVSETRGSVDLGLSSKQGVVWVLEPDKVPRDWLDKDHQEGNGRNNSLVVSPVKKYAKVEDGSLILKESDGSHTSIQLEGCTVESVSASNLPSRKWSKRYPIKMEKKNSVIYKGDKALYIYLESNWEKESWCKSLRLASSADKQKLHQFSELRNEFHNYLKSLKEGYPAFKKPAEGFCAETSDRELENKVDGSSSKVRTFLKKLAKKASKGGSEYKANWTPSLGREEQTTGDKLYTVTSSVKNGPLTKDIKGTIGENMTRSSSSSSHLGSRSHSSVVSDVDPIEKSVADEGTFCLNLLVSRLFFDVKGNAEIKNSIKTRIQRSLSSMRTPNYIGEVICTDLDIGNLPPYVHSMRVIPTDMNEPWTIEVDIEYSGGLVLEIETRLEYRELELQKGIVDGNMESSSIEDVSSDLIEGIEHYGKQLHFSDATVDAQEEKGEDNAKPDRSKASKSPSPASSYLSRWKLMVNSIAKQVSEVPFSLSLRVASLRGTMQIMIKPPPADQLWYTFISMPDIEMNLESSVGEHKIAGGKIGLFLVNRFKAAIRETLVQPNYESLSIPWMLADKNDWVPKKVAPFVWPNQEPASDPPSMHEGCSTQFNDSETRTKAGKESPTHVAEKKSEKLDLKLVQEPPGEPADSIVQLPSSINKSTQSSSSLQELVVPLLGNNGSAETSQHQHQVIESPGCHPPQRYISLSGKQSTTTEDDEKPKQIGRKARMFDLGKKMGEKLEEKRRQLEEKSRNVVEKMRSS